METIIQIPNFCDEPNLYNELLHTIPFEYEHMFKRNVCHYNGESQKLNDIIIQIQQIFEREVCGAFLNLYNDGNHYAPYHSDKYGKDTILLSVGTTRILRFKENNTKVNTDFELNSGDILFVHDNINNNYKHSLLARKNITDGRISVLFFLS